MYLGDKHGSSTDVAANVATTINEAANAATINEADAGSGDKGGSTAKETENAPGDKGGENDEHRPQLRNLETLTTLGLGHVDDREAQRAVDAKYDVPLWQSLFDGLEGEHVTTQSLLKPTSFWVDTRIEKGDIDTIDPGMKEAVDIAEKMIHELEVQGGGIEQSTLKKDAQICKIIATADAMIETQRKQCSENSDRFRVNHANVMQWKQNKIELLNKAHQCAVDERCALQEKLDNHLESMVTAAYEIWTKQNNINPCVTEVDCYDTDLMQELESIMEGGPATRLKVW